MKLSLTKDNFGKFRSILNSIAAMLDEGTFNLTPTGFEFKGLDRSAISYIELEIKRGFFKEYIQDGNTLSMNIEVFKNFLNRFTEETTIRAEENEIIIQDKNKRLTMRQMDLGKQELPNTKFEFTNEFLLDTAFFKTCINDSKLLGDTISMGIEDNKLVLEASGAINNYRAEIGEGIIFKKLRELIGGVKTLYPTSYLEKFLISPIADVLKIRLSNDFPLEITQTAENISFRIILAPRVAEK